MASAQTLPDVAKKIGMSNFITGSAHLVSVTHINDPGSFYVRLITLDAALELLQIPGEKIKAIHLKVGKRVVYKSNVTGEYVRGDIESIYMDKSKTFCAMRAIDYGLCEKEILLENICIQDPSITDIPGLAIHCELYLCKPKEQAFEESAINAMRFFVGKHTAKITVMNKTTDKLVVELKTVECPDDVSTMLGLLNFTTFTTASHAVSRHNASNVTKTVHLKYKKFNVGDRLPVRVQSGSVKTTLYVSALNDYDKYVSESFDFAEYCKRQPEEDVKSALADGRCCGVKVGVPIKYERGCVKRIVGPSRALVKLVDTGKDAEVQFKDVLTMNSESYARLPAIAIYCKSVEVKKPGVPKYLHPGFQFNIEFVEVGNGIDIPHKVIIWPMPKC